MKNYIYTLVLISLVTFSSCKNHDHDAVEDNHDGHDHGVTTVDEVATSENKENIFITELQFKTAKMLIGNASQQNFPEIVKTTGTIDVPPQNKEIISSFSGGYIKKSDLLIGDYVKKGDPLLTIENPDFVDLQQEYQEIAEQLTYLKSEYDRQKTLYEEQITSQKNYLKAQSEYKNKKARYNGLRKRLQMLNISPSNVELGNITSFITLYASIEGSITQLNVSIGTHVSPEDVIMEIVNTDHIHLELTVFEKNIMQIKKDQKINFTIPEASDAIYEAEVHLVGTAIDRRTRTAKIHGHLEHDKKHNFAIGMFVDASIETTVKKALALPETAVLEEGEHKVILVFEKLENGKYTFKQQDVEVGKTQDGFTEIISTNIVATDKILIKGGYSLVGAEGGGHSH